MSDKLVEQNDPSKQHAWLDDDPGRNAGIAKLKEYFSQSPDADTPAIQFGKRQAQRQFDEWYYNQFLKEGAPQAGLSGHEKNIVIETEAQHMADLWIRYDDFKKGTYRLNKAGLDWKGRAMDTPERMTPLLNELSKVIQGSTARPSPSLVSLLQVNGVDMANPDKMREFLATQRNHLKQVTPAKATP
jgi:hypothetical protein